MQEIVRRLFYGVVLIAFGVVLLVVTFEKPRHKRDYEMILGGIALILAGIGLIAVTINTWRLMDKGESTQVVEIKTTKINFKPPKQSE